MYYSYAVRLVRTFTILAALVGISGVSSADYLSQLIWYQKEFKGGATCIYGEIEVVTNSQNTHYCGCNWWPSSPAGGYTGIQELTNKKVAIFSVWDTTAKLPTIGVERGNPMAKIERFDGGEHSLHEYKWGVGRTYRYFVVKRQDTAHNRTLVSSYFYDDFLDSWVYEATMASPNINDPAVTTFGGMTNAFIQNIGGDTTSPRLAIFRLWTGTSPNDLACVTEGEGHGKWGILDDSFFLSVGDTNTVHARVSPTGQIGAEPTWGAEGQRLKIPDRKLPKDVVASLKLLMGINEK